MTFQHIIIGTTAAASLLLASCSCGTMPGKKQHTPDPEAVKAGTEAAKSVISVASDEEQLSDRLLEIRSDIYQLSLEKGDDAAADFEDAFEQYIRQNNDSLARILF